MIVELERLGENEATQVVLFPESPINIPFNAEQHLAVLCNLAYNRP
jgi:hypothetical protein